MATPILQAALPQSLLDLIRSKRDAQQGLPEAGRRYADIYTAINNWVKDPVNAAQTNDSTKLFFAQVTDVNNNVATSPANVYIRAFTRLGYEYAKKFQGADSNGNPLDLSEAALRTRIQTTSTHIAEGIFRDALEVGGIPRLTDILRNDAASAVTDGQTWAGWGGALFFLNEKVGRNGESLAKLIFSDSAEGKKFANVAALTMLEVSAKFSPVQLAESGFADGFFTTIKNSFKAVLDGPTDLTLGEQLATIRWLVSTASMGVGAFGAGTALFLTTEMKQLMLDAVDKFGPSLFVSPIFTLSSTDPGLMTETLAALTEQLPGAFPPGDYEVTDSNTGIITKISVEIVALASPKYALLAQGLANIDNSAFVDDPLSDASPADDSTAFVTKLVAVTHLDTQTTLTRVFENGQLRGEQKVQDGQVIASAKWDYINNLTEVIAPINGFLYKLQFEIVSNPDGSVQDVLVSHVSGPDGAALPDSDLIRDKLREIGFSPRNILLRDQDEATAKVTEQGQAIIAQFDSTHPTGAQTLGNLAGVGSSFIDSLSLLRAIQSGQPLPVVASGLRLASGIDNLLSTPGQSNYVLSGAASAASSILSIISLERSLQRGDALGALSSGGQALSFATDAYLKLAAEGLVDGAGNVAASQLRDFLNGTNTQLFDDGSSLVLSNTPAAGVLPYLNLALAIRDGNPISIASSVLAFIPGAQPIAFALQAFQLIDGLFGGGSGGGGQLPDSWGNANLRFTGNVLTPGVTYDAYGTDNSTGPVLGSLLAQMNTVLANAQAASPTHPLGLIPMRMPNLSVQRSPYTGLARFAITDINPLTGAANHPGAFYDDSGRSYGALDNPEALQSLSERYIRSSLAREAIAPLWEVRTAFLRNALGDPNAGFTEEESAARLGKQGVDPNSLPTLARLGFRPVLLDLNSDGVFSTYNLVPTGTTGTTANPAHAFDAQDDGYLRSTGWVKSTEGILVLDRNLNGTIDSGREVFSNGRVNDASKGTASLAWVDANLDGVLNSSDPVFNELQVWVDANGDGASQTTELTKLAQQNITAINYAGNTFTRSVAGTGANAGTVTLTTSLLASADLQAERDGTQQSLIAEGLLIQSSNGTLSLIVNNVQDQSAVGAGQDGLTGIEDAQLIVGAGDLTQNDTVAGFTANALTVTGVSNANHGSVTLVNGVVTFTPEANWFTTKQSYDANRQEVKDAAGNTLFAHVAGREAGFDYTVAAPGGATATFHADVALKNVNDAPVIAVVPQGRDVYGTLVTRQPLIGSDVDGNPLPLLHYVVDGEGNVLSASPLYSVIQTIQYAPFTQPAIPADGWYYSSYDSDGYPVQSQFAGVAASTYNTVAYIESYGNNRGQVRVTDADGDNQTFTFSASYGSFGQGVVRSYGSYAEYGYINWSHPGVPGADFAAFSGFGGDGFYAFVTDEAGATASAGIGVRHAGGFGGCAGSGGCSGAYIPGPYWPQPPLVVDLAGNGFSFKQGSEDNPVFFDTNGDGYLHRTSWIKPGMGFVAYDFNSDGKITSAGELQFTGYARGAATDLEGLRAFDTNGDGVLSALDNGWSRFGIWQDANSNGVSEAGEFQSMDALGVASLSLVPDQAVRVVDGQTILGQTTLTLANGQTRAVADVALTSNDEVRINITNPVTGLPDTLTTVRNAFAGAGEVTDYGAGDNLILGKPGSGTSIAGDGDNVIYDDGGDDGVKLGDGNNVVFTGTGNDVIVLGNGANAAFGGEGNDIILAGNGQNALLGEGGNDVILAGDGNALLAGGDGNDLLRVGNGVSQLFGGNGRDVLFAGNGGSQLFGGAGDDELNAGSSSDLLDGGTGADALAGGAGDDTYVVDNALDSVIENVNAGIDTVRSSIDTTLGANVENLVLTGVARNGGGNALDNLLIGNDSDNTLAGFAGNDVLRAGLGNDVYVFCKGDGQDTIDDAGGSLDILRFRQCASPSEVAVSREATGLRFTITTTGDSVLVKWDPANGVGIERVEFPQDGTVWDKAMLDAWANRAPLAGAALSAQAAVQGSAFSFTVPLAAFSDADYADRLTFSAVLSTGEPLPAWLSFNSATRTLSGTPADADVGTPGAAPGAALSVTIRATDAHGLSAIQALNLTVANVNDAPVAAQSIAAQSATQDAAFTFTIPAGAFTDADARFGDVLSYTVLQADGAALPGWLNYDAATRTLTGTPLNADVGSFNLRVTATDTAGATAAGVFAVNVANVNDAPMAYADSGAVQEDVTLAVSGNLLANDVDIDVGTVLRVTSVGTVTGVYGTLALNANGAYTYTLDNSAANVQGLAEGQRVSDVFSYTMSDDDAAPLTAASTLTITITGSNDAPVVTADTAIAREDVTLTASGNLLANDSDVDQGAVLSVVSPGTLVGAYGSLTVAANGAYTYTLNNASAAVQGLRGGEAVSDTFNYGAGDGAITTGSMLTVTVLGKNDAPVAQNDSAAVTEDATLTATGNLLANDSDMDRGTILTVAAPGSYTGAYGTLSLAANGAYTYTLNNASIAVQSLAAGQRVSDAFAYSVRDNDANPLSAAGTLVVNVTGSNDAPVVTADTAIAREDVTLSASGNLLLNDSDVDQGAVLSVASPGTFAGTYGSLTVAANGAYTYTLNNASAAVQGLRGGEAVTDTFNYGAGDGAITTGSMLTVTVIGTNDAPVTQNDSAAVVEDATLTATGNVLANDSDIDRSTVLSVAAPGSYTGAYGTLAIAANGSYTYTLNNAAAAVQSLGAGQRVTDTFAYTARDNDAAPLTAAGTLVVSVTGANDAPVLATAIAAQNGREAQAFSFTVPVVTFSDADQGDRLTYGAQLLDTNGVAQALPSWLVFNPATRSFAGSPGLANGGSYQLRVTATDLAGASVSGNFALTILDSFASANGSTLTGSAGGDTLNGTNANEAISGLGGNDRLFAGAGADTLSGGLGADVLDAGAGDDTLLYTADARWGDGAYVLNVGSPAVAGTGARIELENRNRSYDQFIGAAGRDTLVGTSAGDVIALDDDSGPLGALGVTGPRISGIEVINAGDGNDVVDLTSTRYAYGDVTIDGGNGDDVIWSNAGSDTLIGGAGNDQLVSGAGADSLDGGSGSDTLVGGSGNDTYLLGRGYGNDTIIQAGSAAGDLDTARFLNGISVNQLWFGRHGNDLQVSVIGTSDRFSIDRWYKTNDAGGADINKVEQFQTSDGGKTLLAAQVQNLVNAMAAFAPPAAGQTSLSSAQSAALNPVIAANWH